MFCTYENAHYGIFKDLMSTVYIPVSKYHFTNILMKENDCVVNDCVVNAKSVKIGNEKFIRLQFYRTVGQNNESESFAGRSKRISKVGKDPNIPLDLISHGEMFAFSTLSYKSCIHHQYLRIILNYDHLSKE